jgi:hypothetical protein
VIRLYGKRVAAAALMGSSISEAQVALLREHCPNLRYTTMLIDDAGRKAAVEVAAKLSQHWWTYISLLPDGTQPDTVESDLIKQVLGRKERPR